MAGYKHSVKRTSLDDLRADEPLSPPQHQQHQAAAAAAAAAAAVSDSEGWAPGSDGEMEEFLDTQLQRFRGERESGWGGRASEWLVGWLAPPSGVPAPFHTYAARTPTCPPFPP